MRVIALEEHVAFRQFTGEIDPALSQRRGMMPGLGAGSQVDALNDVENRLRAMDEAGIDVQVLSIVGAGADLLPPDAGPGFARRYNDELAAVVSKHPDRFSGFAHLPLTAPEAAADELERTVREHKFCGALISGHTNEKFLDDPMFEPVIAERKRWAYRSTLIREFRRRASGAPITTASIRPCRTRFRMPAGVGTPRPRCTSCGSCCRARSTVATRSFSSSSATWAKGCRPCWPAAIMRSETAQPVCSAR